MYIKEETLGKKLYEIVQKKFRNKDLYDLEEVLEAVEDKICDLENDVIRLEEEIRDLTQVDNDVDLLYELEAGK